MSGAEPLKRRALAFLGGQSIALCAQAQQCSEDHRTSNHKIKSRSAQEERRKVESPAESERYVQATPCATINPINS